MNAEGISNPAFLAPVGYIAYSLLTFANHNIAKKIINDLMVTRAYSKTNFKIVLTTVLLHGPLYHGRHRDS